MQAFEKECRKKRTLEIWGSFKKYPGGIIGV